MNITKDVHAVSAEEDTVYLPASWLAEVGADQDAGLDHGNAGGVECVVDMPRGYLDDGEWFLEAMALPDGNTLAAWTVLYQLAVMTLRERERRPGDAVSVGGVKLSRKDVYAVLAATASHSLGAIPDLRVAIRTGPLHQWDRSVFQ